MDIKVNEPIEVNQTQAAQPKNQDVNGTFKFTLVGNIEKSELQERLTKLMKEITEQGERIAKHMDIKDMRAYRAKIKEFMNEVSANSHEFSRENFLDRRGRHRVYGMVKLVDKNTVLLSVMSASNISGYLFDMETICREARKINPEIYIVSDAVQHMPHGVLNVAKLGLDACNFAPYKAFGIRGCGYGYVSDRVAVMEHHKLLAKPEKEWELGTFPHPNFAAITAVVDYVCWLGGHFTDATDRRTLFVTGMDRIHLQEHSLLVYMMEGSEEIPGLRHIPGVQVFLDSADTVDRDLISAIGFKGFDMTQAVAEYYKRGITVFDRVNTSLYSKRIVESLGLTGCIRVSPLHCHDTRDIDEFLKITAEIAKEFAQ